MERLHSELIRYDPAGLGRNESITDRRYYVAEFSHDSMGNYVYQVTNPEITFSYAERLVLLKARKKSKFIFKEGLRNVPKLFSESESTKLQLLRTAIQRDGLTEFLVDFIPRYSIDSVLRELDS